MYISKHSVSETRFCLHLQVKPTQLSQTDRANPYLRTIQLGPIDRASPCVRMVFFRQKQGDG
jgi:hypothetical protein